MNFLVHQIKSTVAGSILASHDQAWQQLQSSIAQVFEQILKLLQHTGHMGKCRLLIQAGKGGLGQWSMLQAELQSQTTLG